MAPKKKRLRIFVSSSCGPCQEIKDAVAAGRFNAEEVELIDIGTKEGFKYVKRLGLTKAPSAYLGKQECELLVNSEENSIFIDCDPSRQEVAP